MANYITRTITVYTYVTGKFNSATMTMEDIRTASFPYKLGAREKRKLEAIQGAQILGEPQTSEKTYRMSLESFIEHATEVKGDSTEESTDNAE